MIGGVKTKKVEELLAKLDKDDFVRRGGLAVPGIRADAV